MTTTSLTRRNVTGSAAAARARLVSGPTATMEIVSGGLAARRRSISSWAGAVEGVNAGGSKDASFEEREAMTLSHVSVGER